MSALGSNYRLSYASALGTGQANASVWSTFPATSNVDMANYSIENLDGLVISSDLSLHTLNAQIINATDGTVQTLNAEVFNGFSGLFTSDLTANSLTVDGTVAIGAADPVTDEVLYVNGKTIIDDGLVIKKANNATPYILCEEPDSDDRFTVEKIGINGLALQLYDNDGDYPTVRIRNSNSSWITDSLVLGYEGSDNIAPLQGEQFGVLGDTYLRGNLDVTGDITGHFHIGSDSNFTNVQVENNLFMGTTDTSDFRVINSQDRQLDCINPDLDAAINTADIRAVVTGDTGLKPTRTVQLLIPNPGVGHQILNTIETGDYMYNFLNTGSAAGTIALPQPDGAILGTTIFIHNNAQGAHNLSVTSFNGTGTDINDNGTPKNNYSITPNTYTQLKCGLVSTDSYFWYRLL